MKSDFEMRFCTQILLNMLIIALLSIFALVSWLLRTSLSKFTRFITSHHSEKCTRDYALYLIRTDRSISSTCGAVDSVSDYCSDDILPVVGSIFIDCFKVLLFLSELFFVRRRFEPSVEYR